MENTNIVYITHNKQTSLDKQNDMWQKFTNVVVRPQLDTTRRDSQNTREKTFGIKQRRKDDIRWQLGKIPANVRNISAIIFGDGTQIIFLVLIQSAQRSSVGWRWHILNTIYIYRTEKFVHIVIFHIPGSKNLHNLNYCMALPERLRGVFTTRRHTNSRLPLPSPLWQVFQDKCT